MCVYMYVCVCVCVCVCVLVCVRCVCITARVCTTLGLQVPRWPFLITYTKRAPIQKRLDTGRRRNIGCLNLQVSFRKRSINYRDLLRKIIYKDKASYASSLRCNLESVCIDRDLPRRTMGMHGSANTALSRRHKKHLGCYCYLVSSRPLHCVCNITHTYSISLSNTHPHTKTRTLTLVARVIDANSTAPAFAACLCLNDIPAAGCGCANRSGVAR